MKWKLAVRANCSRDRNSAVIAPQLIRRRDVEGQHPPNRMKCPLFHPIRGMWSAAAAVSLRGRRTHGMQVKQDRPVTTDASKAADGRDRPGDVLVAFGITGDLAKQMTLRSLYRLDSRGLLDTPVVGVAVDDWTTDRLRQHAHDAIAASGEKIDESVF